MKHDLYAVYGVSGFGREVMPLARELLESKGINKDQLVFIDDNAKVNSINGHAVYRYADFMQIRAASRHISIAIAEGGTRQDIAERVLRDGNCLWQIKAANVVVMDDVELGDGAILCPFVTLTSNIKIGKGFQANIYSYVAHDCRVGDFVTFAPRVMCNGNIIVEDRAYIGTGAVIKQGRPGTPLIIGKNAIVGMGAVVTKSVSAGTTVVGNPAQPLKHT